MNMIIIDAATKGAGRIVSRFKVLKTVKEVGTIAEYWQAREYCQVRIKTTLTVAQVETILYKGNFDYVGAVLFTGPEDQFL